MWYCSLALFLLMNFPPLVYLFYLAHPSELCRVWLSHSCCAHTWGSKSEDREIYKDGGLLSHPESAGRSTVPSFCAPPSDEMRITAGCSGHRLTVAGCCVTADYVRANACLLPAVSPGGPSATSKHQERGFRELHEDLLLNVVPSAWNGSQNTGGAGREWLNSHAPNLKSAYSFY